MILAFAPIPLRAQSTDRAKAVGHRLFCMCGCKQILVECNHVGCTMSTRMLKQLDAEVASGKSDDLVLQSFVQDFGGTVVAEPPAKGFNIVGWIMPFAVVGLGLFLVRNIVSRWSKPVAVAAGAPPASAVPSDVAARIRHETEDE